MNKTFTDTDGRRYSITKLWKAAEWLPVCQISVPEYWERYKDIPCFGKEGAGYSPYTVLFGGAKVPEDELLEHWRRVLHCDLLYPILLTKEGVVADGMHRLMKAHLERRVLLLAQHFEEMPLPALAE